MWWVLILAILTLFFLSKEVPHCPLGSSLLVERRFYDCVKGCRAEGSLGWEDGKSINLFVILPSYYLIGSSRPSLYSTHTKRNVIYVRHVIYENYTIYFVHIRVPTFRLTNCSPQTNRQIIRFQLNFFKFFSALFTIDFILIEKLRIFRVQNFMSYNPNSFIIDLN